MLLQTEQTARDVTVSSIQTCICVNELMECEKMGVETWCLTLVVVTVHKITGIEHLMKVCGSESRWMQCQIVVVVTFLDLDSTCIQVDALSHTPTPF